MEILKNIIFPIDKMDEKLNLVELVTSAVNTVIEKGDINPLVGKINAYFSLRIGQPLLIQLEDGTVMKPQGCWNPGGTSYGKLQSHYGIIDKDLQFRISDEHKKIQFPTKTYITTVGSQFNLTRNNPLEVEEGNITISFGELPDTYANWKLKSKADFATAVPCLEIDHDWIREFRIFTGEEVERFLRGENADHYRRCYRLLGHELK